MKQEEWYCHRDLVPMENFQFLWGWNLRCSVKYVSNGSTLSIPLRMKRWCVLLTAFWRLELSIPLRMKRATSEMCRNVWWNFQFLWGWNTPCWEGSWTPSSREENFQFLWGWNGRIRRFDHPILQIELSIPLRMKQDKENNKVQGQGKYFQFLWGWNGRHVHILIMLKRPSFNSFEDETVAT